jgi:hypothetical protein
VSLAERLRHWRPEAPALPEDLARLVKPGDPRAGLVPLCAGEPERPAVVDPTRPTTAVAAFPGGVVL